MRLDHKLSCSRSTLLGLSLCFLILSGCEKLFSNKKSISGTVTEFGTGRHVEGATVQIYGEECVFGIWGSTCETSTLGAPRADAEGNYSLVYKSKKEYERMWLVPSSPDHFNGPEYHFVLNEDGDAYVNCQVYAKGYLRFRVDALPGRSYQFFQTNRVDGTALIGQFTTSGGVEYTPWMEVFGSVESYLQANVNYTGASMDLILLVEAGDSMTFLLPL